MSQRYDAKKATQQDKEDMRAEVAAWSRKDLKEQATKQTEKDAKRKKK